MNSVWGLLWVAVFVLTSLAAQAEQHSIACEPNDADCLLDEARSVATELTRTLERDEAYLAISSALARLGHLEQARNEANNISNAIMAAQAEAEIVLAAARRGEFDYAFEVAVDIADSRNRSSRVLALETLAVERAAVGDIDGAFDTVVAIDNPFRRSQAQSAIAVSVARSGDIPNALRTAARIGMDYWFTAETNRYKVASGLVARNGEFDHHWFYEAMADIAEIQAVGGDLVAAKQTALAIPDVAGQARAMAAIAAVQAASGELDAAYETARRIESAYGDRSAMKAIAAGLLALDRPTESLELARDIQTAYGDGAALGQLAIWQADNGDFDAALATASTIIVVDDSHQAHTGIAMEYAQAGLVEESLDLIERIPDRSKRFDAVETILSALVKQADAERAMAMARSFARGSDLSELHSVISLAQMKVGDVDNAFATASLVEDPLFFAITLAGLASP